MRRSRASLWTMDVEIDATDQAILGHLRENGRRSYRQIARDVGVSEGTVRARVRRLEEIGVLRILAFVDLSRLGRSVLATVLVGVQESAHDQVVETLSSWPGAAYVSSVIGSVDIYVQVICPDNQGLWELIRRVDALPGVTGTDVLIEMAVHKFTYQSAAIMASGSGRHGT